MLSVGEPLAISSCSEVELLSALGVKVRTRQLSKSAANDVINTYSRLVAPQLHRISVEDADHRQAVILLDGWRTALRPVMDCTSLSQQHMGRRYIPSIVAWRMRALPLEFPSGWLGSIVANDS